MRQKLSTLDVGCKIKSLREQRRFSMRELSAKADVAASLVSKIEAGKVSPTVTSLQKILTAMDVDFYEFFSDGAEGDPSERLVFPRSEMVVSDDGERKWRYAFPRHSDIKMQLTHEEYQPHTQAVERESHREDIAGIVISGELNIEALGRGRFTVKAGDAFYVKAGQLHSAHNDGDKPVKLVVVERR